MNTKKPRILLAALVVSCFLLTGAGFISGFSIGRSGQNNSLNLGLVQEVYVYLKSHYVDPEKLGTSKLIYGAIGGMVKSVGDRHTYYLNPEQAKKRNESEKEGGKEYAGIGIAVLKDEDAVVVASVFDNTPAQKEGLRPGDYIVKVGKKEIADLTIDEIVKSIRGPVNTSVKLSIWRRCEPELIEVKVARAKVQNKLFNLKTVGNNVAYIKLSSFEDTTDLEFRQLLSGLKRFPSGIILDLRNNPGGILEEAQKFAGWFLKPDSTIAILKGRTAKQNEHKSIGTGALQNIPLVVLVNKYSASASEIFAGAVRFHRKTPLVGQKTFGKGSAQIERRFRGGSILHITIENWLTPDGTSIGDRGVEVDHKVTLSSLEICSGRVAVGIPGKDPQLDKAIELLKKDKN